MKRACSSRSLAVHDFSVQGGCQGLFAQLPGRALSRRLLRCTTRVALCQRSCTGHTDCWRGITQDTKMNGASACWESVSANQPITYRLLPPSLPISISPSLLPSLPPYLPPSSLPSPSPSPSLSLPPLPLPPFPSLTLIRSAMSVPLPGPSSTSRTAAGRPICSHASMHHTPRSCAGDGRDEMK